LQSKAEDDTSLIDGEKFLFLLSNLSSREFNYFLQFHDPSHSIDHSKIPSAWQQFKHEFVCIKSDDKRTLILYSLRFIFTHLILPSSLTKNAAFLETYAHQVKDLVLYRMSPHIVDIFPIMKRCHRIHSLELRININFALSKVFCRLFTKSNLLFLEISEEIQLYSCHILPQFR
jgi:hypothetical protein